MENNFIHTGEGKHVNPEEVNCFEADLNYASVVFDDGHKVMVATGISQMHTA